MYFLVFVVQSALFRPASGFGLIKNIIYVIYCTYGAWGGVVVKALRY
jgi:hypothetical protein